jgi:hypothetical protein
LPAADAFGRSPFDATQYKRSCMIFCMIAYKRKRKMA